MNKEKIYHSIPIFMQNMLTSLYGYWQNRYRYNKNYYGILAFLKISDFFTKDQKIIYQKESLSNLLISLKKNNYYKCILSNFSNDLITENPFEILEKMPILSKEEVIKNYELLASKTKDSYQVGTSGTTGKALKILKTPNDMSAQTATWTRHRSRFGIKHQDLSVNFTGKLVVSSYQIKPPFWRYNKAWNQYLINMQHINKNNIKDIVEFLNTIKPKFYSGYPSIIGDLCSLALESNLSLNHDAKPIAVFCGAENLLKWQEEKIKLWLGCVVSDLYGLTEGCCNLSKCQHGYYHEDFELCYSELINKEELEDGKIQGNLVGTGFFLESFPLVRYDTGDMAVQMPESFKCKCGREGKVYEKIIGRVDDYVLTLEGAKIMRFDYLFKDTLEIEEVQVIQEKFDTVIFKIKLRNIESKDYLEKILKQRFEEWISKSMKLEFEYVDFIEKTKSGKFKAVINKLKG
jgi:phenylacetate-CoA ligase